MSEPHVVFDPNLYDAYRSAQAAEGKLHELCVGLAEAIANADTTDDVNQIWFRNEVEGLQWVEVKVLSELLAKAKGV